MRTESKTNSLKKYDDTFTSGPISGFSWDMYAHTQNIQRQKHAVIVIVINKLRNEEMEQEH